MLPVVVVGIFSLASRHPLDNPLSGFMAVATKSVDPPRPSPFALLQPRFDIWPCRYDGSSVVSRSVDLGQPIIFVSMNYR
jgi:hypothetical protein